MRKLYLTVAGCLIICISACTKAPLNSAKQFIIHPGDDITIAVSLHAEFNEFLLETGSYSTGHRLCIARDNIILRKRDTASEVRITDPIQIIGNNNTIDGLTWDGRDDQSMLQSDPGTLAVAGSGNTIRHCTFRNMQMPGHGLEAISIGRQKLDNGQFANTVANNNTIEDCLFDNWGLRDEPKGSTKSSTCIAVGEEDQKGNFTGTIIRNNRFLNGPYKQYGYNAAVKVFNSVTLENNIFFGGQECMEIKYGNSTIRGNTIHHFSGYNILANRSGRNNLYDNNIVYDIRPIDKQSSSQGFMIWDAGNTVYRNNLIYDCAQTGLILGKQTAESNTLQYVLIANNTFISNNTGIHFNNQMGSPRHVSLIKNILCGKRSLPVVFMLTGFDPKSIESYSGNLYFNNSNCAGDDSPLLADPQFVDTAINNFSLQASSPACGYGAYPCANSSFSVSGKGETISPNVVIYPTRKRNIFHIGLTGLDETPFNLQIQDNNGATLYSDVFRNHGPADLKIVRNVNLTQTPPGTYIIKILTSKNTLKQYLEVR